MVELKYAVVEQERRWLLPALPGTMAGAVLLIRDRYLDGTRLRLREVTRRDGSVVRKLGHKVRLGDGPDAVAHTSLYLDEAEWNRLSALPARSLTKRRTLVDDAGTLVAVDQYDGHLAGLVTAEIDSGEGPARELPHGWEAVVEVTTDERYTGAALARAHHPPPVPEPGGG